MLKFYWIIVHMNYMLAVLIYETFLQSFLEQE